MSTSHLSVYLSVCEEAARSAGGILREMLGKITVRHKKNPSDLVTEADLAAQKRIESILLGKFPEHGFIGEEERPGAQAPTPGGLCWIVDPLDGTTNFVHGFPCFGPSIALTQGDETLCGVVYNPITDELFSAAKGQGAFLNGERLHTSSCQTPETALAAVSFPTQFRQDAPDLPAFLGALQTCQSLRRLGSTALNLAYVAAGRFDAMWAFTCHPWDIAAGWLLVQEAGGMATKPDGSPVTFSEPSPIFAAATEPLHNALAAMLCR